MLRKANYLVLVLILSGCIVNCSFPQKPEKKVENGVYTARNITWEFGGNSHQLTITYTGTGGLIIAYGDEVVVTDPFFSHTSFTRATASSMVGVPRIKVKPKEIEKAISDYGLKDLYQEADALLIGHAHYDHLLDVPYLMEECLNPSIAIFGSNSTCNALSPFMDNQDFKNMDKLIENKNETDWDSISPHMKVKAIKGSHASHFGKIHLMKGEIEAPIEGFDESSSKTRARRWKEGQVYAYLLDVQPDVTTSPFRIYIVTSSADAPDAIPDLADGIKVNLSLLCAASTDKTERYPQGILKKAQPEKVVLIHWESFFRPYHKDSRTVAATNFGVIEDRLKSHKSGDLSEWVTMPERGVTITCEF